MAHQITLVLHHNGSETMSSSGLSATHSADALRRLCRKMVAAGLIGPAEVRGLDGRLRLTIRSTEGAARYSLQETDNGGFRLLLHRPHPQVRDTMRGDFASGFSRPSAVPLPAGL